MDSIMHRPHSSFRCLGPPFTSRETVSPALWFSVTEPPWTRDISAILTELNIAGLHAQTVNDLLTVCVGAASQHVLRVSLVPEDEAKNFDTEVVAFWSQFVQRDAT